MSEFTEAELLAQRQEIDRQLAAKARAKAAAEAAALTDLVAVFDEFRVEDFVTALRAKVETLGSGQARLRAESTLAQFEGAKAYFVKQARLAEQAATAAAPTPVPVMPAPAPQGGA